MSITLAKTLTEQRQNIWDKAKGLLDAAEAEKRDLTAAEQQQFDAMSGDLTALRGRIDTIVEAERINREIEESLRGFGIGTAAGQPDADPGAQLRSLAKKQIEQITIEPRAWGKTLDVQTRALSKGTATAGGNTVPTSFYDQLVQHLVDSTSMLQLGPTIINTTSGETLQIPVTTSYGAAALTAEGGAIAGTDPAFGQRSLGAYKYAQLVTVSRELIYDSAFDIAAFVAAAAGLNIGLALGAHLIAGTGTAQPTGVLTSATTGVTGGTAVAGAFTADNLIDLMFSVVGPYRASASAGWLVKDASLGAIRKLKDGAGRYLYDPAPVIGAPDVLLGKPIKTDANMPGVGLSAKSVAFGDFSRYFVRFASGVRFERSDDFAFSTDQVAFRCIVRADGILADQAGAIKTFVGGAS